MATIVWLVLVALLMVCSRTRGDVVVASGSPWGERSDA